MQFDAKVVSHCQESVAVSGEQILKVLHLLIEEKCTVPFVARYRKEMTGNLDEVQIRQIQEGYENYLEIEKRRAFIHETLQKMEVLTPEMALDVARARTLEQLEDIYAPYKSKKKTKAMIAQELGLGPLAALIMESPKTLAQLQADFILPEGVADFKTALDGARDIITEKIAHHMELKERLRQMYWEKAICQSEKRAKAEEIEEYLIFKDFFDFKEPVAQLRLEKNSHRYLAMRRGMSLKVLKVDILFDEEVARSVLALFFLRNEIGCADILRSCCESAYRLYIHPSLDLEIKTELKRIADEAAIKVFGVNLKNLLLAPYLGAKCVMGVDPGVRTGCKVVVIDASGKLLVDFVIYPHEPQMKVREAKMMLEQAIDHFKVEYIAIGNGTYGRETLALIEEQVRQVQEEKVKATMISEAGASIYSASDIARKEFPDKDTTVRGAVSIARRFQDPLAELVKIDPKSIGVGQYQHDVNESRLKKSLSDVVESCVNYVGVDLNTASAPLLAYISGIGPKIAENIVAHRQSKGRFRSRQELLDVPRFSQKIFEQAAGFLRIYEEGGHPLDGTFIHPEKYPILEAWSGRQGVALTALVSERTIQEKLERDRALEGEIGPFTFKDIVGSLKAPAQDPRKIFKSVEFSKLLRTFKDLQIGQWYTGVVNNITAFGAFVDIGIKESGLLHISEMADRFVEDPLKVLQVGQEIKVKVVGVDAERKRISLSCKAHSQEQAVVAGGGTGRSGAQRRPPAVVEIKNNAFAQLKNINLKR